MNIVTWNMQGGLNTQYLNTVLQNTGANVLCLQECGALAELLQGRAPILDGNGATIGYTGNLALGYGFMECVYWENAWVQGSVAVLTNVTRTAYGILGPAVAPYNPPGPRSMPWMTVTNPTTGNPLTVYSIHAPPVFGATTLAQVCSWNNAQIAQIAAIGAPWACVGDFNADPTAAGYVGPPAGGVVRGTTATQQGGGIIDYSVTNVAGYAFAVSSGLVGASDHYPQTFLW